MGRRWEAATPHPAQHGPYFFFFLAAFFFFAIRDLTSFKLLG
jgi:hypothetical protein